MMQEDFDKVIRGAVPEVTITDDRVARLISHTIQAAARPERRARWGFFIPVLRFAVPAIVAVILGVTVSESYVREAPVAQFSTLYLSTTLVPVGS
jgi:hypothetical protein